MTNPLTPAAHLHHIAEQAARLVEIAMTATPADLARSVPTCPGWTLRDLLAHLDDGHRWARGLFDAGSPGRGTADAAGTASFAAGTHRFLAALRAADPSTPAAGHDPADPTLRFWLRFEAHEHAIHRLDAELALGREPGPFDRGLAADGIGLAVDVELPRRLRRGRVEADRLRPVRLTAADEDAAGSGSAAGAGDAWLIAASPVAPDAADARVTGTADALYRLVWGRRRLDDPAFVITGDRAAAARTLGAGLTP